MIWRVATLSFLLTLSYLCFQPVKMEDGKEESMELGTQSQSQMDTSDSQNKGSNEVEEKNPSVEKSGEMKPDKTESDSGSKPTNNEKSANKTPEENMVEEKKSEKTVELKFPTTLEGFGYKFDEDGKLGDIETGEPFVFKVRSHDDSYNQKRYEALGEVITEYVYELLEKEANLKRVHIPVDASEGEAQSFIFMTEDALTNPDKLLLLIHGSGVVRAGQWARRLIINDNLKSGTQLPFIKRAVDSGYGVIVFNTNENRIRQGDKFIPVRESSTAVDHGLYVWEEFVSKSAARNIAIVAHSYGGVVTVELAIEKEAEFKERVFAIALTDSVHSLSHQEVSSSVIKLFKRIAKNWVSSKEPLDTPVPSRHRYECPQVSAGTNKHEETSWSSFESIFEMLDKAYKEVTEIDKEEL
ncbi:cotranscriptional regulator ARB2A-like [Liolophura sinensis]|uniref:cotranscriptional regulator ARB2A-like n=1 Tax=Liolophura sinensis TaxID=3198878 RepID=UPI003157FCE2